MPRRTALRFKKTLVHITHETTQKSGGVGAVLEGLVTSSSYLSEVERSIIIGPLFDREGSAQNRLGPDGKVLYCRQDEINDHPYAKRLADVEQKFNVSVIYGRRTFFNPHTQIKTNPEVILIDIDQANPHPVNALKAWMYDEFGIESNRYENDADYEQYVRLGPAALAVLHAIDASSPRHPSVLISHEYMGMPTVLAAALDPLGRFKTIYYTHEVPTVRRIVESHSGHDTRFYPILEQALAEKYYLPEIFGNQDEFFKHALVSAARFCDNVIAVSDKVVQELRFLSPEFDQIHIDRVYHGLESHPVTAEQKLAAKGKLKEYAKKMLGESPDIVFSHVCRLMPSKGLWRDLRVLEHLDREFQKDGRTAVFFLICTDSARRDSEDVIRMEQQWNWPLAHREGWPDLSEAEADFYSVIQAFNLRSHQIKVIWFNQFGWDRQSCGRRMPEDMQFTDLRMGADVEFGQSIYEPFGIAQLETLVWGDLCVISSACGCLDFVRSITGAELPDNIVVADYTKPDAGKDHKDMHTLLQIDRRSRDLIEHHVSERIAGAILQNLPQNHDQIQSLVNQGSELAAQMSWDAICRNYFLPALNRAYHHYRARQTA